MKRFVFTVAAFGAFSSLSAQEIVITGIDYPGRIAWTNLPDTNALYRVEWASSLQGPWRFTFDGLGGAEFRNLPGWTNSRFEAEVPMAYRVSMITSTPPVGMVYIPGGTFAMGNPYPSEGFSYEVPVHTVTVSSFWMSRTEVTRAEWDRVLDWALNKSPNLYQFSNTNYFKSNGDMPVVERSWYDIAKWCNAKSEMEGREPAYWFPDGIFAFTYRTGEIATVEFWRDVDGYRMPTEAEWEYAARGGLSGKRFPCGDTISHLQANYTSSGTNDYDISPTRGAHPAFTNNFAGIAPVGMLAPNGYGLYDMAGNLRELCSDRFASNYYEWGSTQDPTGPTGTNYPYRVVRDGSSGLDESWARVSVRVMVDPASGLAANNGFRLVTVRQ